MATHPHHHEPPEPQPGDLPVEPDQGPDLPGVPEDPEHDQVVDPLA